MKKLLLILLVVSAHTLRAQVPARTVYDACWADSVISMSLYTPDGREYCLMSTGDTIWGRCCIDIRAKSVTVKQVLRWENTEKSRLFYLSHNKKGRATVIWREGYDKIWKLNNITDAQFIRVVEHLDMYNRGVKML